ncbi:MAG: septum site-determining protein MinC [Peptococcaceae bacterium]|nr:septum site-determining protein MinC [Peptococcaceae bacterium]
MLDDRKKSPGRQPSDDVEGDENTILIRRTLRSGQKFYYNGNVVIMGDVNPGAEVVATGNVIVMGQLRGLVHAGAEGDESAAVMAFRLLPTQLRIANHITRPPDNEVLEGNVPEIARIKNGVVTIESYHNRV